jgi:bifunctional non-homologous end joining protein LigD
VPRQNQQGRGDAGQVNAAQSVDVEGRRLVLRNLDKVLYPQTGTTKNEVIAYYFQVAAAMLPHLSGRPLTRKRWPGGVEGPSFFEKNLPQGTPDWIPRVTLPAPSSTMNRERIVYPLVSDLAGLIWVANLAALELHVPQWTVAGPADDHDDAGNRAETGDRGVARSVGHGPGDW